MSFSIRAALPADEEFIFKMLYQALYVPPGGDPFPISVLEQPDISRYAADFGTRPGDSGLIAEAGNKRIAAAWTRMLNGDNRGYGYVDDNTPELSVAVVPLWRSKGVGTGLLSQLIDTLPRISLSTDIRNPAIGLYERIGFAIVSTEGTSLTMLRSEG